MTLTGFQQFIVDRYPAELWPNDIFAAYLFERVPIDDWREWIERRVLEAVRGNPEQWPTPMLLTAATGKPVALPNVGETKAHQRRKQRALRLLEQNDEVQQELIRLRGIQPTSDATEEPDLSRGNWQAQVWAEASSFAEVHLIPKVPADDVASYLFAMATHQPSEAATVLFDRLREAGYYLESPGSWALRDSRPQLWANVSTQFVPLTLPPGAIVVDVSRSTLADLQATWKAIEDAQKRLGQPKDKGGRPENEALYLRVEELRRTKETWPRVAKIVSDEFPLASGEERDHTTLGRQFRAWARRAGRSLT